jgi:hypothetical protein
MNHLSTRTGMPAGHAEPTNIVFLKRALPVGHEESTTEEGGETALSPGPNAMFPGLDLTVRLSRARRAFPRLTLTL